MFHGIHADLTLLPAVADTGIVFERTDIDGAPEIPASCEFVIDAPRRTVLSSARDVVVETVEHLMAALRGLQIDNCRIQINAPEVPGMDGSCRQFCDGILTSGTQTLDVGIRHLNIVAPIEEKREQQSLLLRPYSLPLLAVTYHLDYGARSVIPAQVHSIEVTPASFYREIASARTFVLETEINALKKMGYGNHLTTRELVVVGCDGVIGNQLRWADEFVRHKILDCIGDLGLSDLTVHGHVNACRSGHRLNHQLAARIRLEAGIVRNPLAVKAA